MKKTLAILALVLSLVVLLCACGATANLMPQAPKPDEAPGLMKDTDEYMELTVNEMELAPVADSVGENAAPAGTEKKIVKNAKVEMNARDVKEAYAEILAFAKENGGYEFSQSMSTRGDYTMLDAEIKIPASMLDAFLAHIAGCGEVVNERTNSDNITDQYHDAETRLKTKRATLEQYYKLLGDARDQEEILNVRRIIDELTEEIESLEGRLRLWQSQVAESTVTLSIRQLDDPAKITKSVDWNSLSLADMGVIIEDGLTWLLSALVTLLQWIAIAIAVASPLLLIGGVVLFVLLRRRKRK